MADSSPFRMRLQASMAAIGVTVLWWRWGGRPLAGISILFALLALVAWISPRRYLPVQRIIDFLVHLLVSTLSWVLLGLVYFGVFTPLRFFFQLTGKDFLARLPAKGRDSSLVPLSDGVPDHFKRQY